jgi:iron-sulfur cluster assembly accessory protein
MDQDLRHEDIPQAEGLSICFTDRAVEVIKEAMKREGIKEASLRVAAIGGGCSGFQYSLSFDESARPDDEVVTQDGIKAFVDPISAQYLRGSTLDYTTGLYGAGFQLLSPNSPRASECRSSFSV